MPPYHSRLSKTYQSEGQMRQNPVQAYTTHQSICPNGLMRLDQFCYNCNIIYLPGLQNPIWDYTTHQSISPNGLMRLDQFCYYMYCNIICLPGLQNPIRAYTTYQSISLNGLVRPEQFRRACHSME